MASMRKLLLFALTLVGLFDALYLFWVYTSPSQPMVCLGSGCDVVRASDYSRLWGITMPAYGIVMYLFMAVAVFSQPLLSGAVKVACRKCVVLASGGGVAFSIYLTYLEGWVIRAWCAWCVASAVIVALIFLLSLPDWQGLEDDSDPALALAQLRRNFVVGLLGLMVGIPTYVVLINEHSIAPPVQASKSELDQDLVRPDSHAMGDLQSPVTVVEFGDFQCPMCAHAAAIMKQMEQEYHGRVRFIFRQFPLASIHPFAEKAAEASECAAEQGKFWEAVDKFYSHQSDLGMPALMRYGAELGLDQARFNQCLTSGSMAARVQQDLADGRAIHVRFTPTFFLGSHLVEGVPAPAQFSAMLDELLAEAGPNVAANTTAQSRPPEEKPGNDAQTGQARSPRITKPAPKKLLASAGPATGFGSPGGLGGFGSAGSVFSSFQGSGQVCSEDEVKMKQPAIIHTADAQKLYDDSGKTLFVDVRAPGEFAQSHIRGAMNLPAGKIDEDWESLPKDKIVVFYESGQGSGDICAAGRAAGRSLLAHGFPFSQVKVYEDGLVAWKKSNLPVQP
jgi:protein-disulfide isomerase/rhodanese-related sulfurtransferase